MTLQRPGDWKGLVVTVKLTIQTRQAQPEVVPSAPALVGHRNPQELRDRREQSMKHWKHHFDEIVNTAPQMLGTSPSVGCTVMAASLMTS